MSEFEGYEYDTTKVEVDLGGRHRTFDLKEWQKLRPQIDITGDITFAGNGHPTQESLLAVMRSTSRDFAHEIGLLPDDN